MSSLGATWQDVAIAGFSALTGTTALVLQVRRWLRERREDRERARARLWPTGDAPRIDVRQYQVPTIRVCPDCGATHATHPAIVEMRCKACMAKAWDAETTQWALESAEAMAVPSDSLRAQWAREDKSISRTAPGGALRLAADIRAIERERKS